MRFGSVHLLGLALSASLTVVACADSQAAKQPQQDAPAPAVPVRATAVVAKSMPLEVSVIGTVEAYATVVVRAQITGELTSVNFQQGDDVQAGQVLFTLDRRPLEAELQQATGERSRATPRRPITPRSRAALRGPGAARPRSARAGRQRARERRRPRRDRRRRSRGGRKREGAAPVRRPSARRSRGRTGALMVKAGNLVRANDQAPLAIINQVTPIYVSFAIPEALLPELRRYMAKGALRVEAPPPNDEGLAAGGRITFVDNAVDQTTGTIKIKATFPEPRSTALAWSVRERHGAACDRRRGDRGAVARRADRARRLLCLRGQAGSDGGAAAREVARVAGAETVIKEGVTAGEIVVTDGHLRLVPGSRISVRGAGAEAAS